MVYCREEKWHTVYPADVVLFEGILVFYFKELRDMYHMKLFVDTDPDTRLARRGIPLYDKFGKWDRHDNLYPEFLKTKSQILFRFLK